MKKFILALALFVVMPFTASAALDITSLTVDPTTATPNQGVSVSAEVNRTGSFAANNWMSSKISINGTDLCVETDHAFFPFDINNPFVGAAGVSTSTTLTTAPGLDGLFDVVFKVYQESGCLNLQDTATTTLEVLTPAPPAPASSEPTRSRGGDRARCVDTTSGLYCPSAQAHAEYNATHDPVGEVLGFSSESEIALLKAQLEIYEQILALTLQLEGLQSAN